MPRTVSTVCQKGKCRLCRYPVCEHECHGEDGAARKEARLARRRQGRQEKLQARQEHPELYGDRSREDEPRQIPFGEGDHPSIIREHGTGQVTGIDMELMDGLEPWWVRSMVEGILAETQRNRRYDGSDKRKAARKTYRQTEKGKAARAAEQRRRRQRLIMGE